MAGLALFLAMILGLNLFPSDPVPDADQNRSGTSGDDTLIGGDCSARVATT